MSYSGVKTTINRFQHMIEEADLELSKLFRKSRKVHLSNRVGEILLVDDVPEQKGVLNVILQALSVNIDIVHFYNALDAENYIKDNSNNIRIVIVDILLSGGKSGIDFLDWLVEYDSEMPYIVITGSEEIIDVVKEKFPGIDVLLKGKSGINEFADAIGLPSLKSSCEYDKIPLDAQFG